MPRATAKQPTAVGRGGAVSTVDPEATRAGLRVLRRGGNAVDAAVAAAATLGVTEPYSAGIGGGGFFVVYDAESGKVRTLDGRETAPKATTADTYRRHQLRRGGEQRPVGRCPGTPRLWSRALRRWGTLSLAPGARAGGPGRPPRVRRRPDLLQPDRVQRGPVPRHRPDPRPVPAGRSRCRRSARCSATRTSPTPTTGWAARVSAGCTTADSAARSCSTVQAPPKDPAATRNVRPGLMTRDDLADYRAVSAQAHQRRLPRAAGLGDGAAVQRRLHRRRGAEHPGEPRPRRHLPDRPDQGAARTTSRRARWPSPTAVPTSGRPSAMQPGVLGQLLSQGFADERFCRLDQTKAATKPVPPAYRTATTTPTATAPTTPSAGLRATARGCPRRTSPRPTAGATWSPTR